MIQSFGLSPCSSRNCSRYAFCLRLLFLFSPCKKTPIASYCLVFVNFLNPDRAEKYRRCFFQYAIMPRCQRGHSRHSKGSSTILCCTRNALYCLMLFLHDAPLQGLEHNIMLYKECLVLLDAVLARCRPRLFNGGVPTAFPAPTKSIRFPRLCNFNLFQSSRRYQEIVRAMALTVALKSLYLFTRV